MKSRLTKKAFSLFASALALAFITACEGGHLANIEVDITDVQATSNPEGLVKKTIKENSVIVYVDTTKIKLNNMTLDFSVSEGATYEYVVPNAKQDTKNEDINPDHYDKVGKIVTDYTSPVYILVKCERTDAETGTSKWNKVWKIKAQTPDIPTKYTFDNWEEPEGCLYWMPFDYMDNTDEPMHMWASTCGSLDPIWKYIYGTPDYTVYGCQPTDDAVNGKALKLVTADISQFDSRKPFVSGCLFMGEMDNENTDDQLKTRVGLPFYNLPKTLKFYYKYQPGTVASTGKTDEGFIRVVLFKTDNNVKYLTGYNIKDNSFSNTVAYAELKPNEAVNKYTLAEIPFTYKEDVNNVDLANGKYSIGIYFASSLGGFEYSGCGGTTLYIDEMEIVCE